MVHYQKRRRSVILAFSFSCKWFRIIKWEMMGHSGAERRRVIHIDLLCIFFLVSYLWISLTVTPWLRIHPHSLFSHQFHLILRQLNIVSANSQSFLRLLFFFVGLHFSLFCYSFLLFPAPSFSGFVLVIVNIHLWHNSKRCVKLYTSILTSSGSGGVVIYSHPYFSEARFNTILRFWLLRGFQVRYLQFWVPIVYLRMCLHGSFHCTKGIVNLELLFLCEVCSVLTAFDAWI